MDTRVIYFGVATEKTQVGGDVPPIDNPSTMPPGFLGE